MTRESARLGVGALFRRPVAQVLLAIATIGGFAYATASATFAANDALNARIEQRIETSPTMAEVAGLVRWLACRAEPPPEGCGRRP